MNAAIAVRHLEEADIHLLFQAFAAVAWHKPHALFERYLSEDRSGTRSVRLATSGEDICGYVTVAWQSSYAPFREAGVPEIQDLNVLPRWRRRGIATRLMSEAEALIFHRHPVAGLGVGLYREYGAAQRLHVLRGYVPDGRGAYWHSQPVLGGHRVLADDDLVLYLTRELRAECLPATAQSSPADLLGNHLADAEDGSRSTSGEIDRGLGQP